MTLSFLYKTLWFLDKSHHFFDFFPKIFYTFY